MFNVVADSTSKVATTQAQERTRYMETLMDRIITQDKSLMALVVECECSTLSVSLAARQSAADC